MEWWAEARQSELSVAWELLSSGPPASSSETLPGLSGPGPGVELRLQVRRGAHQLPHLLRRPRLRVTVVQHVHDGDDHLPTRRGGAEGIPLRVAFGVVAEQQVSKVGGDSCGGGGAAAVMARPAGRRDGAGAAAGASAAACSCCCLSCDSGGAGKDAV